MSGPAKVENLKLRTSGGKPWVAIVCDVLWLTWTLWLLQDLLAWTKDKSEVEIVDLLLKLRDKLVRRAPSFCALHL